MTLIGPAVAGERGRWAGRGDFRLKLFPHSDLPEFKLKNPGAPAAFANVKLLVNGKTHANALAELSRRLIESRPAVKGKKKICKKLAKLIKM